MQEESKVGPRGQIVIPKAVRDALRLRAGERMLVELQGDRIVLRRRPPSYASALRGLHSGLWQGVDAAAYVDEERRDWDAAEDAEGPRASGTSRSSSREPNPRAASEPQTEHEAPTAALAAWRCSARAASEPHTGREPSADGGTPAAPAAGGEQPDAPESRP